MDYHLWVIRGISLLSGVGFREYDSKLCMRWFMIQGFGFRVQGSRISGFGFRVSGVRFEVVHEVVGDRGPDERPKP